MKIKNLKINLLFICVILCLCGCSKESDFVSGAFGTGDSSKIELESNNQGVEITVNNNEEDEFKIQDEIDFSESISGQSETLSSVMSEEELEIESQQSLEENYKYYSNIKNKEVDIRDVSGYQGALEYVNEVTIEKLKTFDKSYVKDVLKTYEYLSKSDLDYIINSVYSDDPTVIQNFEEEIKHKTEPGWFQDESGVWVNVYEVNKWE